MQKIILKEKELFFNYNIAPENIIILDIGDGQLIDKENDKYFIHVEHDIIEQKTIYQIWFEDSYINATNEYLSEDDKESIEKVLIEILGNL